jgi:diacylglycerol kinase family enzyme
MATGAPDPERAAPIIALNPRLSRLGDPARRQAILEAVRRSIAARTGCEPSVVAGDDPLAMVERVASAVDRGAPLIVVVGGDGTVRDIATVVVGRGVPLAIIPVGTANLFAGSLGIPLQPEAAARAIAGAAVRRVDLGRVRWGTGDGALSDGDSSDERFFVVGVGMGFDARVMVGAGEASKRRLGRYAYFLAAARELIRAAPTRTRLLADAESMEVHALEVLVANSGSLIPGVLRPALPISPGDGRLDVFVIEGRGAVDAAWGGLEAIVRRGTGRSRSGRSRRLRVRTIRVTGAPTSLVEVDGDVVGAGWFEAACLPRALPVLVPPRPQRIGRRTERATLPRA